MISKDSDHRVDVQTFVAVPLFSVRLEDILDFDLYLKSESSFVLYRAARIPFNPVRRDRLLANQVDHLYILVDQVSKYHLYLENNLANLLADPQIPPEKKARILYDASSGIVKSVLVNPNLGKNIHRCRKVVSSTVHYLLQGQEAFHELLKLGSFDYHTYTHSVQVSTYSIALARQLGIEDEEFLNELGLAGLIHDVGKSRVSKKILLKPGALTEAEFEVIKHHPQWGVDILGPNKAIPKACRHAVLEHHERGDRSGYPRRLSLNELHPYSKIVAICDCFDAMTTKRVYKNAFSPYRALQIMVSAKGTLDSVFLRNFIELLGPDGLRAKARAKR
ncbi:MAG: HD-GYP domain-containing protein [Acidobacteriota bacterium]